MIKIDKFFKRYPFLTEWYLFIFYYLVLRFLIDVSYELIYAFILVMLLLKIPFEKIAFNFLVIAVITYLLEANVEANHYLSFVYGFLFLVLIRSLFFLGRDRFRPQN